MSTSDAHDRVVAGETLALETKGAEETQMLGARLARLLGPGDCVALFGELATGKTQLVKGIACGLGIDPREVTSPTFVLHATYQGRLTLHHVDAYRMKSAREMEDLALAEYLDAGGLAVIEWADRVPAALPAKRIEVTLEHAGPNRRRIAIRCVGIHSLDLSVLRVSSDGVISKSPAHKREPR